MRVRVPPSAPSFFLSVLNQRYKRKYITSDRRKVFHSFRHNFCDNLKQWGVEESIIAELVGHSNQSITAGRYGKRYRPEKLLKAIRHLDYGIEIIV